MAYKRYREVLWALDVALSGSPAHRCVINFLRSFGGPIHIEMRRYRYVEDRLMIGHPETDAAVEDARRHVKLWHRVDHLKGVGSGEHQGQAGYEDVLPKQEKIMFSGMAELLEQAVATEQCGQCYFRLSHGAETSGQFGGVKLCSVCQAKWQSYMADIWSRVTTVFPQIKSIIS